MKDTNLMLLKKAKEISTLYIARLQQMPDVTHRADMSGSRLVFNTVVLQ